MSAAATSNAQLAEIYDLCKSVSEVEKRRDLLAKGGDEAASAAAEQEIASLLAQINEALRGLGYNGGDVGRVRARTIKTILSKAQSEIDLTALWAICNAHRVGVNGYVTLPMQRLETMSRGHGWCRLGRGESACWGERDKSKCQYIVRRPGRWLLYGHDGFKRSGTDEWIVSEIKVGDQLVLIANPA